MVRLTGQRQASSPPALRRTKGKVLWCVTRADLFAPALAQAGLAPDRLIHLEAGDETALLACFEEGLRHGGLGAVIAEVARLSMTASRRLQLAAEGTRLNRTHLLTGRSSWLLLCLVRAEKDITTTGPQQVSVEDSFSHVYGSIGARTPASEHLKSEVAIVCGLAKATLPAHSMWRWDEWAQDYAAIRALISRTWPDQFADMEERMNEPGGFYRGNSAHEREWKTESGKAEFTKPAQLDATDLGASPGLYRLMTVRSNDQFNTTVYGYSDRLRGVEGSRNVVMISRDDMDAEGLAEGDEIALVGACDDGVERRIAGLHVVPYDLPQGSLAGYFPELNALSPLSRFDRLSKTPAAKAIPVRIEPALIS